MKETSCIAATECEKRRGFFVCIHVHFVSLCVPSRYVGEWTSRNTCGWYFRELYGCLLSIYAV